MEKTNANKVTQEAELSKLREEARTCNRCELYKRRTNVVFGEGNIESRIIFIGEAPGFNEDKTGVPFVGAAGKNFDELLKLAGIRREDVFITNILKCRPPNNRDPTPEEAEICSYYLKRQINLIQPKLIVALGRIAGSVLLGRPVRISKEHGQLFDCKYGGWECKLFLTFHPAAAIYNKAVAGLLQDDFRRLFQIASTMLASGQ